MVGKMSGGIPKNLNNSLSHCCECKFINIVRLALVTSVTCAPPWQPPVRFCMWWWCQVMSKTAYTVYHIWTNFKGWNYWGFAANWPSRKLSDKLLIKEQASYKWDGYWLCLTLVCKGWWHVSTLPAVAEAVLKVVARLVTSSIEAEAEANHYTFNLFCMTPAVHCNISWKQLW